MIIIVNAFHFIFYLFCLFAVTFLSKDPAYIQVFSVIGGTNVIVQAFVKLVGSLGVASVNMERDGGGGGLSQYSGVHTKV